MDWHDYVRSHLPPLGIAAERETGIVDELAMQLEAIYERAVAGGATHDEALAKAAADIGDWQELGAALVATLGARPDPDPPGLIRRARADAERGIAGRFADLRADVRTAIRSLRHAPLTSLGALITLAIGIGATTALFSVANGVLFKPLPFPNAARLVVVSGSPVPGWPNTPLSFADAADIGNSGVFEAFGSWMATSESRVPLAADRDPEEVQFAIASSSFFDVLGVTPVQGRNFTAADDQLGAPATVIVSHGLWQRRFGPATKLASQTIALDGRPHDIVGVLPPGFRFATLARDPEVWLPLSRDANPGRRFSRGTRYLVGVGRLKDGQDIDTARSGMAVLSAALAKQFPQFYKGRGFDVTSVNDRVSGGLRAPLGLLLGAVAFVAAGLRQCRRLAAGASSERQREMAIRTRWRQPLAARAADAGRMRGAVVDGRRRRHPDRRARYSRAERVDGATPSPFVPHTFRPASWALTCACSRLRRWCRFSPACCSAWRRRGRHREPIRTKRFRRPRTAAPRAGGGCASALSPPKSHCRSCCWRGQAFWSRAC